MTRKPVDLAAVRRARELLAADMERYPELRSPEKQARTEAWIAGLARGKGGPMAKAKAPAAKGRPADGNVPLSIRLPTRLIEEIDAEAERIAEERPGMDVARADAIRVLLVEALAARGRTRKGKA